jgi:hypothetical protein
VMGFDAAASADRAYLNYFHMILAIQWWTYCIHTQSERS